MIRISKITLAALFSLTILLFSCSNDANKASEALEETAIENQDTEAAVANPAKQVVSPTQTETSGSGSSTTSEPERKRMSNTAKGALIGAGAGAITGAVVSKKKGKGAIVGGVIGAGAGAIAGKVIDRNKERNE